MWLFLIFQRSTLALSESWCPQDLCPRYCHLCNFLIGGGDIKTRHFLLISFTVFNIQYYYSNSIRISQIAYICHGVDLASGTLLSVVNKIITFITRWEFPAPPENKKKIKQSLTCHILKFGLPLNVSPQNKAERGPTQCGLNTPFLRTSQWQVFAEISLCLSRFEILSFLVSQFSPFSII